MSEEENVAIIEAAYKLWSEKSPEAVPHWLDLMTEDVDFQSVGEEAAGVDFARPRSGKEDMIEYFEHLRDNWEMLHYTIDDLVAQRDRVVAIGSCGWKHLKTGKTVESPKIDSIRMKDGKITHFLEVFDTAKASAAATA